MEEFKDIVKRKRIEKGYSQNQLAKKLNISQSFMNQIAVSYTHLTLPTTSRV